MSYFHKIRESFLKFFEERGHAVAPSSSLMSDDPSVLLTTAGMQQFKKYYTGELNPISDFSSARTVSIQKCFRTSDIDEVGDDTHLTFFEMMGNFSFGPVGSDDPKDFGRSGYLKRSAIVWGYEFITNILQINPERIHITVFGGDEEIPRDKESYDIWLNEIGLPEEKIKFGSRKDNFWGPTGNEGPCGPTAEIYVAPTAAEAMAGKGIEVWNVVFNEYYKTPTVTDKTRTVTDNSQSLSAYMKVNNPGIDTGMGYERLLATLEGVENVYETSAFVPMMEVLNQAAPGISQREIRILADHIRAASFLIADGIEPSNKEAGYILRRLLRRIIAIKIKNDIHSDIFQLGYEKVREMFKDIYPEINDSHKIISVWQEENNSFQEAISQGLKREKEVLLTEPVLTGPIAFDLQQSYGLPPEISKEFAGKISKDFDNEYEISVKKHQEVSRAGVEKKFGGHGLVLDTGELKAGSEEELKKVLALHTATHLLQWALRKVLNSPIHQMGSDVNPERLRFDFNFDRKPTPEEIIEVEKLVNEQVEKNLPVYFREMPKAEAEKIALSFFKEKYPDIVKVYFVGSEESGGIISAEFCGGPHVSSTKEIGRFKIVKEESIGKGIRRIRAVVA